MQSCKENQCHKRLCDTVHKTVCPHKKGDNALVTEFGGAFTPNQDGVLLDHVDGDGNPKLQYLVTEKTIVPLVLEYFKEDEKMTEYVQ